MKVEGSLDAPTVWALLRERWRRLKTPEAIERRRNEPLSEHTRVRMAYVARLLPDETDWLVVKKMLLKTLRFEDRALFSYRDEATKLHQPFNRFEQNVRAEWRTLTGHLLVLAEEKRIPGLDPRGYL